MAEKEKKISYSYAVEWATISVRTILLIVLAITFGIYILYRIFRTEEVHNNTVVNDDIRVTARFLDFDGDVEVKAHDQLQWLNATFKTYLQDRDRIKTGADSSAKIRFETGNEMTIGPDTIVEVRGSGGEEERSQAKIEYGTTETNTENAKNPAVVTTRKNKVVIDPGAITTVSSASQRNEDTITVKKGHSVAFNNFGQGISINRSEQVKIDDTHKAAKVKLPPPPALFAPPNGQLIELTTEKGLTVKLEWQSVRDMIGYDVQVSESRLFTRLLGEKPKLRNSSLTIAIPGSGKKQYFWRVRSINAQNLASAWGGPFQFVVQPPAPPEPGSKKTQPALSITYMSPLFPFVQIQGQTEPDVFLTLNGEIIDIHTDGSFVHTYTLQKMGKNDLVFIAENPARIKTSVTKTIYWK